MGYLDDIAKAKTEPRLETLEEARRVVVADLTRDEYTLARIINSEGGSRSVAEMLCIGDADLNKSSAAGKSVYDHATGGAGYGAQESPRPVSTARAPGPRHVQAALALTRPRKWAGFELNPPARGISKGARRYFNPRVQLDLSNQNRAKWCPPLAVLEKWTFNAGWSNRSACLVGSPGSRSGQEEWVGPIAGVDAYAGVMLLRPATSAQAELYAQARQVIESRGGYQGRAPSAPLVSLLLIAAGLSLAAYAGVA